MTLDIRSKRRFLNFENKKFIPYYQNTSPKTPIRRVLVKMWCHESHIEVGSPSQCIRQEERRVLEDGHMTKGTYEDFFLQVHFTLTQLSISCFN